MQWRKHLHIEADALSRQLMPPGIPSLRQVCRAFGYCIPSREVLCWGLHGSYLLPRERHLRSAASSQPPTPATDICCTAPLHRLPACLLGPQVLHSTVVEILLFMTPRHRADIVASLVASLNATYARFKCRNPSFEVGAQLQGGSGR